MLEFSPVGVTFTATDGHQLMTWKAPLPIRRDVNSHCIIPTAAAKAILAVANSGEEHTFSFTQATASLVG
ncbi:hypothetical protein ACI3PL_28055, partial [Lacticaseibacillus paracasei]